MRVIPAVDIRGGLCVNLVQGDFDRETVFSKDPVAQTLEWVNQGADLIHIVDLDGAKQGKLCVGPILKELASKEVRFEIGGGIRTMAAVQEALGLGAERVILGTVAYRDPNLVKEAAVRFPGKIVVGIDAKEGRVALSGWTELTDTDALEFAEFVEKAGVSRIIYTDIGRDGMLQGPNFEAARKMATALKIPVTLSGGVSSLGDIRTATLLEQEIRSSGGVVDEIIVGRALYVGAFTLSQALEATRPDL